MMDNLAYQAEKHQQAGRFGSEFTEQIHDTQYVVNCCDLHQPMLFAVMIHQ